MALSTGNTVTAIDAIELARVVAHCRRKLELRPDTRLGAEYFYASLPLCVIDAVYSINARYASVENVIARVCERLSIRRFAPAPGVLPAKSDQLSIPAFLARIDGKNPERLAVGLFGNRQRTSARSGILKAEAVFRFARVLDQHLVHTLQDGAGLGARLEIEAEVKRVPGQESGLSWRYFAMLAGEESFVKPDRMILRFLGEALGREPAAGEAQAILAAASNELRSDCPAMTPRLLDHLAWKAQRGG